MLAPTTERNSLTREQRFVGAICGADWSVKAKRVWNEGLYRDIDWAKIPNLAWQHKIRPMMAATLREAGWPGVPAEIRAQIESAERACSLKTMAQLHLLAEIAAAAKAQDIRVIALKGVALSLYLYGDPFIREAFDLDLLVSPGDSDRFDAVLTQLGCAPISFDTPLTPRQTEILHRFHHDKKFVHAQSGTMIECHCRFNNNPHLIATDFDALWQSRANAGIGTEMIAILGRKELIYYLAIHAARHCWQRWKWIADLAALYQRAQPAELAQLRNRTVSESNEHLFDSSLLLTSTIAGIALPQAAFQWATLNKRAQVIASRALRISSRVRLPSYSSTHRYVIDTVIHCIWLKRSWRYIAYELVALFHHDGDWHALRLPDRLIWLYYLLRPLSYVWRRANAFISAQPPASQLTRFQAKPTDFR